MASFWSGGNVRLVGGAAGSMSSVTFPFWARAVTDAALVKVMDLRLPVSPWSDEWLRQVSHFSLTDRVGRRIPQGIGIPPARTTISGKWFARSAGTRTDPLRCSQRRRKPYVALTQLSTGRSTQRRDTAKEESERAEE